MALASAYTVSLSSDGIHGCKPGKLNKGVYYILTLKTELCDVDTKQLEEIESALSSVHCKSNHSCIGCFCRLAEPSSSETTCLFNAVHRELENRKRKSVTMGECVDCLIFARDEISM